MAKFGTKRLSPFVLYERTLLSIKLTSLSCPTKKTLKTFTFNINTWQGNLKKNETISVGASEVNVKVTADEWSGDSEFGFKLTDRMASLIRWWKAFNLDCPGDGCHGMFIPDTLRSCMVEPDVSSYLQTPSSGQVPNAATTPLSHTFPAAQRHSWYVINMINMSVICSVTVTVSCSCINAGCHTLTPLHVRDGNTLRKE